MKQKMILCGSYGAGNLGDEAILQALVKELEREYDLTVMSAAPSHSRSEWASFRKVPRSIEFLPSGIRSWLRALFTSKGRASHQKTREALKKTDLFVLGGGTLLTDEPWQSLWIWKKQVEGALKNKKRVWVYKGGLGPLQRGGSRRWVAELLQKAERVVLRDPLSMEWAKRLGSKKAELSSDPVLNGELTFPQWKKSSNGTVVFVLRDWIKNMNNIEGEFVKFIHYLYLKKGVKIIGIVFENSAKKDTELMNKIFEQAKVGEAAYLLPSTVTRDQILKEIASAELVVGMRLHSLIFAHAIGTPFIAINYAEKNRGFLQCVHKENQGIALEELTAEKLIQLYRDVSNSEA